MLRLLNNKGVSYLSELLVLLVIVVGIAAGVATDLGDVISGIDVNYRSELGAYMNPGE